MDQAAFVLRIKRGRNGRVEEAVEEDQLNIGWAKAEGLLNEKLSREDFKRIITNVYYPGAGTLRKAGAAAGHMWRFIRHMKEGDLVVVPSETEFFLAKILGPAIYDPTQVETDSSYRRRVEWLNGRKAISRKLAGSKLRSRMKIQNTSANASDLLEEIKECLVDAESGKTPTFQSDLQSKLIEVAHKEIQSGKMDSHGFERLIETVLQKLGATDVRIVARQKDKGADLLATFLVANAFSLVVAVQAKHWQFEPDRGPVGPKVVEQLIKGIESESAGLGMVITSGAISKDAFDTADKYFSETEISIKLIDGQQFAQLVVEHGLQWRDISGKSSKSDPI